MFHRIRHHVTRHLHRAKHHLRNAFVPHEGNEHRPHALRHKALTAYAVAIVLVKVVVSGLLLAYPGPSATANLTPANVIDYTNRARQTSKVQALATNQTLMAAAQQKAADMMTKGYFAHISPTKVTPWYWFQRAGYKYSSAGENLAMDFSTAEDVVEAWLASPSHRKNLLNAKYKDIGVAVVSGKLKGTSTTIVVQFFGAPAPTRQQPKPVTKVTSTVPPPTPKGKSGVAVATPPQPVLGETTEPPPPPLQPKLTDPSPDIVLASVRPWVSGESEPKVTIHLTLDGQAAGSTTSDENGYFRLQPDRDFPDGRHTLAVVAVGLGGQSPASQPVTLTVDTLPPSAAVRAPIVLPSYVQTGAFTVTGVITGDDIAGAGLRIGNATTALPAIRGPYLLEVRPRHGDAADAMTLELRDAVGNESVVPVASLSFFDVDILEPASGGFAAFVPKLLLYSRKFFITFWLFLFLALAVNVIVKIHVQHRATVLYTLLLLYGLTIVLVTS